MNASLSWLGSTLSKKAEEAARVAQRMAKDASNAAATFSLDALVDPTIEENRMRRQQWPDHHRVEGHNFTYVCDRVVAMGFPRSQPKRTTENRIDDLSAMLKQRHPGHFMVWNLSEEYYDYSKFDGQVQDFRFPGHPAPPLAVLFKIINSIESWLAADPENIAVIHCLTGRGRTVTVIACFLAWVGEFSTATEALSFVAERRCVELERVVIPSQTRYVHYFCNVMAGTKPRSEPLLLKRIIVNTIPKFCRKRDQISDAELERMTAAGAGDREAQAAAQASQPVCDGCRPYIQIFQNGRLLFSSLKQDKLKGKSIQEYYSSDGSFSFDVNHVLIGDVLLRCRHMELSGKRVSMFRAGFHTGYIPELVQRLPRSQCDGAAEDKRFEQDFFVDLIFAPVNEEDGDKNSSTEHSNDLGTSQTKNSDQSLAEAHLNSKFWREIAKRKERLRRAKQALAKQSNNKKMTTIDLRLPKAAKERMTASRERLDDSHAKAVSSVDHSNRSNAANTVQSSQNAAHSVRAEDVLLASRTAAARAPSASAANAAKLPDAQTSKTRKHEAFSLADDDDDDMRVVFDTLQDAGDGTNSEELTAIQKQQADADRSVEELAALEAELGLEGEDFAVSPQLKMLGKETGVDAAIVSQDPGSNNIKKAHLSSGDNQEKTNLIGNDKLLDADDFTAELEDIDNMDLDKLLAGPGAGSQDDILSGKVLDDLTLDGAADELDDLDDFLSSLDK